MSEAKCVLLSFCACYIDSKERLDLAKRTLLSVASQKYKASVHVALYFTNDLKDYEQDFMDFYGDDHIKLHSYTGATNHSQFQLYQCLVKDVGDRYKNNPFVWVSFFDNDDLLHPLHFQQISNVMGRLETPCTIFVHPLVVGEKSPLEIDPLLLANIRCHTGMKKQGMSATDLRDDPSPISEYFQCVPPLSVFKDFVDNFPIPELLFWDLFLRYYLCEESETKSHSETEHSSGFPKNRVAQGCRGLDNEKEWDYWGYYHYKNTQGVMDSTKSTPCSRVCHVISNYPTNLFYQTPLSEAQSLLNELDHLTAKLNGWELRPPLYSQERAASFEAQLKERVQKDKEEAERKMLIAYAQQVLNQSGIEKSLFEVADDFDIFHPQWDSLSSKAATNFDNICKLISGYLGIEGNLMYK